MGAALNTASAANAYVLADRGTWLSFKNKGELEIVVQGDKRLFNQYGVILVNPARHPLRNVKKKRGQAFIDWLISPEGQRDIAGYKINGEQLFFPNARDPTPDTLEAPETTQSCDKAAGAPLFMMGCSSSCCDGTSRPEHESLGLRSAGIDVRRMRGSPRPRTDHSMGQAKQGRPGPRAIDLTFMSRWNVPSQTPAKVFDFLVVNDRQSGTTAARAQESA